MPIWYYVHKLQMSVDDLVEDLRQLTACMPASRDAIVHRLRGTQSAYKLYTGKPKAMLAGFLAGEISVPKNAIDLSAFAHALHGLPDDFEKIAEVRSVVLECLKRDKEEKHRTQICRAACRVDEIIHHQQSAYRSK